MAGAAATTFTTVKIEVENRRDPRFIYLFMMRRQNAVMSKRLDKPNKKKKTPETPFY